MASNSASENLTQRIRFALFIKVLFKLLDKNQVTSRLKDQARSIVLTCTRRNREGDPEYVNLTGMIEISLRGLVGDTLWKMAIDYTSFYISHRKSDALSSKLEIRRSRMVSPLPDTKIYQV